MRHLTATLAMILAWADPNLAAEPTPPVTPLEASDNQQVKRGCDLVLSNDTTEGLTVLRPLVDSWPTDMRARACYATALSLSGDHELARQQMSIVLSWKPAWPDGYVVRAVSAAEMGAGHQARQDLELARRLDPMDRIKAIASASQRIDKALAEAPKDRASTLHLELLKAARNDASMEQLVEQAGLLLKASNAERRLGVETYSETRRQLAWAVLARPRDPDRMAALGRFLLDELDVRGDSVEPTGYTVYYRQQDKALKDAELKEARRLFNEALALKPEHEPSLLGLARLEMRERLWSNAERYLRRALTAGTNDRDVLKLLRDAMGPAMAQRSATVANLRMTYRWEEAIENSVYEYAQMPSASDLAAADNYDAQAARLLKTARGAIHRALTAFPEDPVTHDYVGAMAFAARDWTVAARAWETAVKLDPNAWRYHDGLSNVYWELGRLDASMEQDSLGRNLQHTTAATMLERAWDLINVGKLLETSALLDKASSIDPGDARTLAYMAVIAENQGNEREALALYRAAFALEEAHANQRGGSWIRGDGAWAVRDTGRPIELRSRIADLVSRNQPEEAAAHYLKNVNIESWFREAALKEPVDPALLPLPNLSAGTRQLAPTFGELMRTNRARAAVELARLGRCEEAAEHFRKLPEYDRLAGVLQPRDAVWKNDRVAKAAVDCFERLDDRQQLDVWKQLPLQASEDSDFRRLSLTQEGPRGRVGRHRY